MITFFCASQSVQLTSFDATSVFASRFCCSDALRIKTICLLCVFEQVELTTNGLNIMCAVAPDNTDHIQYEHSSCQMLIEYKRLSMLPSLEFFFSFCSVYHSPQLHGKVSNFVAMTFMVKSTLVRSVRVILTYQFLRSFVSLKKNLPNFIFSLYLYFNLLFIYPIVIVARVSNTNQNQTKTFLQWL